MANGKEYLISPERTETEEVFNGTHDLEQVKKISGIDEVVDYQTGLKRLKQHKTIAANIDFELRPFGVFSNPFSRNYVIKHKLKTTDVTSHILKFRVIKQDVEIEQIKEAIDITSRGFKNAKIALKSARHESDIEAVFTDNFIRNQSVHAYSPIVASGSNACTLHYVKNKDKLAGKGMVLIDIGARTNYYAADVTRTWELRGVTTRQQEVVNATKDAFDEILAFIKPGLSFEDYQSHVDLIMTSVLKRLKLESNKSGLRKYFPHAPSHGLGLDVHDPIVGFDVLTPGMVITLEPGIYVPEEGVGARYEDDLLITENGVENLSAEIS